MKFRFSFLMAISIVFILAPKGYCKNTQSNIILKSDFKIWDVNLNKTDFISDYEKTFFDKFEVKIEENEILLVRQYLNSKIVNGIDTMKIRQYLDKKIVPYVNRKGEDVTISLDKNDKPVFKGSGLYGRYLDIEKASMMLKHALENNIEYINLPIVKDEPKVTVIGEELENMGIKELLSSGETYFDGSPPNRMHNIKTGLAKFNGHIIKPGEEFVFGNVLGRVGKNTGYKPELVIKGDRTVPEYGGGLCQVSTTAYRAILAGGFPVTQRKNHSFAVRYYSPNGLDATVYPPTVDLKFINDSSSHILIQSFMTDDAKAYYNFYGTKDNREVYMIGPYYYDYKSPPATRIEYTEKLAPGVKQILGNAVLGLSSSWYRYVVYEKENEDEEPKTFLEHIFSKYQARPQFFAIGTAKKQTEDSSILENGY